MVLGDLDKDVQAYLKALRRAGTPVSVPLVLAAATGLVVAKDRTLLKQHGGHLELKRSWGISLMKRMGYVQRRGSTQSKRKVSDEEFLQLKQSFITQVHGMIKVHQILQQLVFNWDQSGIRLMPSSNWTMEEQGARRVAIEGLNDKRQITVTLAVTLSGELLPLQLLYTGKTNRCHPSYDFPSSFDIYHTPNHWANEDTAIRLVEKIILSYITQVRTKAGTPHQYALVIIDVFKGHTGERLHSVLEENKIVLVFVPNNCTDVLQPIDLSVNKPFKDHLRKCFAEWYSQQVSTQLEDGTPVDNVWLEMAPHM